MQQILSIIEQKQKQTAISKGIPSKKKNNLHSHSTFPRMPHFHHKNKKNRGFQKDFNRVAQKNKKKITL